MKPYSKLIFNNLIMFIMYFKDSNRIIYITVLAALGMASFLYSSSSFFGKTLQEGSLVNIS